MTTNSTTSGLNAIGTLSIYLKPVGSDVSFCIFEEELNKITDKARAHLLRLATDYPSTLSPNPITNYRVGSGGVAVTATGAETQLFTEIPPSGSYDNTVLDRELSSLDRLATYTFELSPEEGNGQSISEVGLFADNYWLGSPSNGKMFNIKTFPPVAKSSTFSLSFVWRINFSGIYLP